jgi:hypothetical protein
LNPTTESIHKFAGRVFPFSQADQLQRDISKSGGDHSTDYLFWLNKTLTYACAVDTVKIRVMGAESGTAVSNAVNMLTSERIAWAAGHHLYPRLQSDNTIFDKIYNLGDQALADKNELIRWYGTKIISFGSNLYTSFDLQRQIRNNPLESREISTVDLAKENDKLFTNILSLRRYGVKPAIAPAPSRTFANEWLVIEPDAVHGLLDSFGEKKDFIRENNPAIYMNPDLAKFISTRGKFRSSTMNLKGLDSEDNASLLEVP